MTNVTVSDITLQDWVNGITDQYGVSIVHAVFMPIYLSVFKHTGADISSFKKYEYSIDDNGKEEKWTVFDSKNFKHATGDDGRYNFIFDKITGHTVRFGKTLETADDPAWCKLGPELLDLEISVNGCPQVGGCNCRFCYKNNTNAAPTNMTFDDFETIVNRFPKTLSQIPFGITGVQTNPDFERMIEYARNELWIVPTFTMSGKDLDDRMAEVAVKYCGACAVSCYEDEKTLCYDTIKRLHVLDDKFHVNMHCVLGDATVDHCMDVLNDVKNGDAGKVGSVVFLTLKPKGRAANLDCNLSEATIRKVVGFCKEYNIGFGFDSCNAKNVETVLNETGFKHPELFCEPCESSKFSSYVNVKGEYHHCSFAEGLLKLPPISVLNEVTGVEAFVDMWRNDPRMTMLRNPSEPVSESCQFFKLDIV